MMNIVTPSEKQHGETLKALMGAPTFVSDKQAMEVFTAIRDNTDGSREAQKFINDGMALPFDFVSKTLKQNSVWGTNYMKDLQVKTGGGLLTHTGQVVELISLFSTDGDEAKMDQEWRAVFRLMTMQKTKGAIIDIKNRARWGAVEPDAELTTGPYKKDAATYIELSRFGGGVVFSWEEFQDNPMVTANDAIVALRWKQMENMKDTSYTLMLAAISTANGAGQFTALVTNIGNTFNIARNALITRNANKGYGLSFSGTTAQSFAHPDLWAPIEAAFSTIAIGNEVTTAQRQVYPGSIQRHYSLNLPTALGLGGGNVAALFLQGFKNLTLVHASGVRFEQKTNFKSDKIEILGQEYWDQQIDTDQVQIVRLA